MQVERLLDRMGIFLRLMHEGLPVPDRDERRINVRREILETRRRVATSTDPLKSAFPVPDWALSGAKARLAVEPNESLQVRRRFERMKLGELGGVPVSWADHIPGSFAHNVAE